jgi:hypothetical protein
LGEKVVMYSFSEKSIIFLIEEDSRLKLSKIGAVVLGIWLILKGIIPLLHLSFSGSGTVLAILAITAGVLILLDR